MLIGAGIIIFNRRQTSRPYPGSWWFV